ncbi:MAG: TolC family protein [Bacteroidota bacterium]
MKTKFGISIQYLALVVMILFFLTQKSSAQKYLSLQECVDVAIKNNISVKQREAGKESVKADLLQSKMSVLPNINGQATNNFNTGFAINPATNTAEQNLTFRNNTMGISANMILFNGFQQSNNIRLQQSNIKASEQDVESTKNTIRLTVANAYLQVLMNTELDERNHLQAGFTREQIVKQQKLYDLGAANKVKLLQLKAQVANEELVIVTGKNALEQSYLTLWQLMNLEPDTSVRIIKPEININKIENEPRTSTEIYNDYLSQSPEVKAAQQRVRSAELTKYVSTGGRSPRIMMNASLSSLYSTQSQQPTSISSLNNYSKGYVDKNNNPLDINAVMPTYNYEVTPFSTQFDRNLGKAVGFTMSVPIFNAWQVNTNIQKSKINEYSAHLTEKQAQNDLYKNISQAHQDFRAAQKKYEATQNSFDANKESYQLSESQFTLGAINTTDYLNIKNEYLKAQSSYVQAKYELVFRRKVLDFYLGKSLY